MKKLLTKLKQFFRFRISNNDDGKIDTSELRKFKMLAGIIPHNKPKGINELMDIFRNRMPGPGIKVITDNHIRLKRGEGTEVERELESLPLSRVTNETRKKIIQLVREDISKQIADRPKIPVINYVTTAGSNSNPIVDTTDDVLREMIENAKEPTHEELLEIKRQGDVARSQNK
jgi:hypothetical protein